MTMILKLSIKSLVKYFYVYIKKLTLDMYDEVLDEKSVSRDEKVK